MATDEEVRRYQFNLQDEIDSAAQYRAMAEGEPDPAVARVYRELAAMEEKHASFWQERLRQAGKEPPPLRPSWRARVLSWTARRFGARMILPTVASREYADRNGYASQAETHGTRMTAQERTHARVLASLLSARTTGASGSELARVEGRHRGVGGNALRAAVLGANDGLCSNLSLIMGVAGASANPHAILLAGGAGLIAGACSMALGEWVSMTSSRELAERQVSIERDELEAAPNEEREELQLIYEAKGLPPDEARQLSERLVRDPSSALDVLSREELGLDPAELGGSPNVAALMSFLLFAFGAAFPLAPFLFLAGLPAVVTSVGVSGAVLFLLGAAITVFTGKPVWRSGGRQLVLGLLAAGVTFGVGRALGVALS